MKTYPMLNADGSVKSFHISNAYFWSLGPMRKILESVEGVTDFKRIWFSDDRYSFSFRNRKCVVNEPYGDNDQYWIAPADPEPPLNMAPIHEAFRNFRIRLTFDREFRE